MFCRRNSFFLGILSIRVDRNRSFASSSAQCAHCLGFATLWRVHAISRIAEHLLGLGCCRVSLFPEVARSGGRTVLEETREQRLEEGAEDDLGATVSCCQLGGT